MENFENLKTQLVRAINESSDRNLILQLWEIMNSEKKILVSEPLSTYESEKPMTDEEVEKYSREEEIELPEAMMKLIAIGEEDIKNGRFYTEEEIDKMDEEWLK